MVKQSTVCMQAGFEGAGQKSHVSESGHCDYQSMKPYMRIMHKHLHDIAYKWSTYPNIFLPAMDFNR